MSSQQVNPLIAVVAIVVAAGLGVGGVLVWNALGSTDEVIAGPAPGAVATQPTVATAPDPGFVAPTPATGAVPTPPAAQDPAVDPPPTEEGGTAPVSQASADISDAMIETALAAAAANPLPGLPGLDEIATVRINDELIEGGYDLASMDISIYPASSADSFILIETSDSTPLLASEAGEGFVLDLINSAILTEYEVERLVMRHTTVDEVGAPVRVTLTIGLGELRDAVATEADLFGLLSVQTEPL